MREMYAFLGKEDQIICASPHSAVCGGGGAVAMTWLEFVRVTLEEICWDASWLIPYSFACHYRLYLSAKPTNFEVQMLKAATRGLPT